VLLRCIRRHPDYGLPRRPGAPAESFPGSEGRRKPGEGLHGLPLVKPPYGVMAAIDLKNGSLLFQVPHGDTPDAVRDHPMLKGMNLGRTGQNGKQYIVVGVSGGNYRGDYISLALPQAAGATTNQGRQQ